MEIKAKIKAWNTVAISPLEFPPGWEIPSKVEFQRKYQEIEFGKDIERGLIRPFSGRAEDYFRFRDTFRKCVHVQQVPIFYKILAFDQLIDKGTTFELMKGLGTTDKEYIERINRIETRFGAGDRHQNFWQRKLSYLGKFDARDHDAVGKFTKSL